MTHTKMIGTVKMKTFWLKYCLISTSSLLRKELQHPPRGGGGGGKVKIIIIIKKVGESTKEKVEGD